MHDEYILAFDGQWIKSIQIRSKTEKLQCRHVNIVQSVNVVFTKNMR